MTNARTDSASVAEHAGSLLTEERRTQIVQKVRAAGRVKVNMQVAQFSTSVVTIRNDPNELHESGLVLRSHGGAVLLAGSL
jgi:DeoR family transcriptional regulator of aga operon